MAKKDLEHRTYQIAFIKHGTQAEIHQELGLDSKGIIQKVDYNLSSDS